MTRQGKGEAKTPKTNIQTNKTREKKGSYPLPKIKIKEKKIKLNT